MTIDHQAARDAAANVAYPDAGRGIDERRFATPARPTPVAIVGADKPIDDGRWRDRAACKGMDPALFFPQRGNAVAAPLAVCAQCPVQAPCRAFAIRFREPGVWGGTTGRDRRAERSNAVHDGTDETWNQAAPFAGLVRLLVAIDAEERGAA